MRSLILDQYSHQSMLKRFLGNMFTSMAWAFWIYLWLPLLAALTLLLGIHPGHPASAAEQSILALLEVLGSHMSVVMAMIAVFFAWSVLQWLGKPYRSLALQKRQATLKLPVSSKPRYRNAMEDWRQAQCIVVNHDENSGSIKQVDILDLGKRQISYGFKKQSRL